MRDLNEKSHKTPSQSGPATAWSSDPMLWPYQAAKLAMDAWTLWLGPDEPRQRPALAWTSPNTVRLALPTLCLRDFSCGEGGSPILICAPYALHRALIADFASGHSIVQALQRCGSQRLYLTDWCSASADMRFLSIDSYLADFNVAIDEIGAPVDLVGLCQGGWLSLVYAARFPEKVRRLVLVGSPVDLSVESELSWRAAGAPHAAFAALVENGGGLVRGQDMMRSWHRPADPQLALQRTLSPAVAADQDLLDRFDRWNRQTLDLPGTYYLQVVDWIFRENRLAKGSFVALGREIELQRLKLPVFLLAGAEDEVVPAGQALATAGLLGTPESMIATATTPSDHLGLFMGSRTLATSWPRIAAWLQDGEVERPA